MVSRLNLAVKHYSQSTRCSAPVKVEFMCSHMQSVTSQKLRKCALGSRGLSFQVHNHVLDRIQDTAESPAWDWLEFHFHQCCSEPYSSRVKSVLLTQILPFARCLSAYRNSCLLPRQFSIYSISLTQIKVIKEEVKVLCKIQRLLIFHNNILIFE